MENKEMKKTIPVELEEEELGNVSGGAATEESIALMYAKLELNNQYTGIRVTESPDREVVYLQDIIAQGPYCSECGQSSSGSLLYLIDGKRYCAACKERLFG